MDFELLSESPAKTPGLLELLERLLTHRRRQWQLWAAKPPRRLALFVAAGVSVELALAQYLFQNKTIEAGILRHVVGVLLLFLLAEVLFLFAAWKGAELAGKPGDFEASMTYVNLSLFPFFFYLPVALGTWAIGGEAAHLVRILTVLFITFKVASYWREAIELTYKFSKIQSGFVMYAAIAMAGVGGAVVIYAALLSHISSLLS